MGTWGRAIRGPNGSYRVAERRNMFGEWVWAVWQQTAPNLWWHVMDYGTKQEAVSEGMELAGNEPFTGLVAF